MKISVKIPRAKLNELRRKFNAMNEAFDVVGRPLMVEESERLTGRVQELTPLNIGVLRRSISFRLKGKGFSLESEITSPVKYAPPVEFGVSPGRVFPPFHDRSALRFSVMRRYGLRGQKLKTATYKIARKIYGKGFRAVMMFDRAFRENKTRIENRFRRLVDDFFSTF